MFDLETVQSFYKGYGAKVAAVRQMLGRPLTLSEKILYAHVYDPAALRPLTRLEDFGEFRPTAWQCRMRRPRWPCCSS